MISANPDMTIRDIRVTMLRMPWADDPWLKAYFHGKRGDGRKLARLGPNAPAAPR